VTEAEWLSETDPRKLLLFAGRSYPNERKLRLYAVAGCRRIWHLLRDERSREAVEAAERYADGRAGKAVRRAADRAADRALTDIDLATPEVNGATSNWNSPCISAAAAANVIGPRECFVGPNAELFYFTANPIDAVMLDLRERGEDPMPAVEHERVVHVGLLRDIFGNPFRPVTADPAWLTSTVVALTRQMYDSGDFSAMPILADALQDAGCENADILGHCRGDGPHARGCWVVDLILGKS
jgi:hypothetical protein